jgi:hypothetical protein
MRQRTCVERGKGYILELNIIQFFICIRRFRWRLMVKRAACILACMVEGSSSMSMGAEKKIYWGVSRDEEGWEDVERARLLVEEDVVFMLRKRSV